MKHGMRLQKEYFNAIKKGRKNIELRLFDEKRQKIQIGDLILFKQEGPDNHEIEAKVSALYHASSFEELFRSISLYDCGYDINSDVEHVVSDLRKIYTEEEEARYGVLGIELSEIYWKTKWRSGDKPVLKYIRNDKWKRMYNFDWDTRDFFTITTDRFVIRITGGSVKFYNKESDSLFNTIKGFNYLYTGDVKPDEAELMALENGKHFYIFSLKDLTQMKRITLPKSYESLDVCGKYSEDGEILYVPVYKFDDGYKYYICQYETKNYTLLRMDSISSKEIECWKW